ncbi:MAG: hypothetical protein B6241_09780 [Spirochaetaceae bacterium 4572_59]|nr:MAG: hypothetical protein B6241_09780 [Spirochaetaceae bacterium 4572_59]
MMKMNQFLTKKSCIDKVYPIKKSLGGVLNINRAGFSRCGMDYHIQRQDYPFYAFEYIIEGKGTLMINNHSYSITEGDVFILQKNSIHDYTAAPPYPWTKVWFEVNGSFVDDLFHLYNLESCYYIPLTPLKDIFQSILESCINNDPKSNKDWDDFPLYLHKLLSSLKESSNNKNSYNQCEDHSIRQVTEYISNNFMKPVSLDDIANEVALSVPGIIRKFRKETGVTPYQFLLQKRMDHARMLLKQTDLTICRIAHDSGFNDTYHFSRIFKQRFNLSPGKYRKKIHSLPKKLTL